MNGPFTHPLSSQIIPNFLMKELFPLVKEIRVATIEVVDMKRGMWQSLWRREINRKLDTYRSLAKQFIALKNKWNDPDELYKDIPKKIQDNPREMAILLQDWNNIASPTKLHFDEAAQLLDQMDRMLVNQNTASYTTISLILSTVAVAISVVAIWATT